MKKRYAEEQISYALKESECGVKTGEICRKMGISEQEQGSLAQFIWQFDAE